MMQHQQPMNSGSFSSGRGGNPSGGAMGCGAEQSRPETVVAEGKE